MSSTPDVSLALRVLTRVRCTVTRRTADDARSLLGHLVRNRLAGSAVVPVAVRRLILRRSGLSIGSRCRISPSVYFGGRTISIGADSFLNREVLLDAAAPVTIGSDCAIAMRVSLITGTHDLGRPRRRAGASVGVPVSIGDGCWIGAGAIVLPGVSVAPGCVIAAGAVVTRDTEPNGMYAGVPARRIRDLSSVRRRTDDAVRLVDPEPPTWSRPAAL